MSLEKGVLLELATKLVRECESDQFQNDVKTKISASPVFGPQLLSVLEEVQKERLTAWGFDAVSALAQLKTCVKIYPDTKQDILKLCDAEEAVLVKIEGELRAKNGFPVASLADQQRQMMAMQMASQSLSEEQKEILRSVQQKMVLGQKPSEAELVKFSEVRQHIIAYTTTMMSVLHTESK